MSLSSRTITEKHQDTVVLAWIKSHYSTSTKILSVCDGAVTAAATGIYDGKWLTTHASDYPSVKTPYGKPLWIQNTSVTQNGNLFSTTGVSNATEGSLTVINELFGRETMQDVAADVFRPTTFSMLRFGIKIKKRKEIFGQLPRLILGGVKSFVGKIPVGNTGGADVPGLLPMEIPADLKEVLRASKQVY
jgi:hypothetical protein